ncbi:hypothetical protein KKH59_01865 [Patescibacteria group bacterium]|nr:hypothetical protein [Patescibacteria group bacterium]
MSFPHLAFRNFPNFGRKKWDKVFYFASRFALAGFAVFFLVSGAAPIKLLQGSLITAINAINGEESKFINFYSSFSEGDPEGIPSGSYGASWQNPERAYGPPDVLPSGDLNSFSETNSAIYKTGPLNLILEKFETGENLENDNFQSAKIKFSFAIGEKKFDLELVPLATTTFATTTTEESTATSTETAATTTEATTTIETSEPQNSILGKIKNLFANLFINLKSQLASFVLRMKELGFKVVKAEDASTTISTTSSEFFSQLDTKIIIWYSLADGSTISPQVWQKLATISNSSMSNALNRGYFEEEAPFIKSFEDVKNLKIKFDGVVGGETNISAYLDSVWVEAKYQQQKTTTIATTTVATTTLTTTENQVAGATTTEATTTNATTTEATTTNATTTETTTTEATTTEATTTEKPKILKPKIKIKDNSLLINVFKKSFSADEEPTFEVKEPEINLQQLIETGKGELIEGEIISSNIAEISTTSIATTTEATTTEATTTEATTTEATTSEATSTEVTTVSTTAEETSTTTTASTTATTALLHIYTLASLIDSSSTEATTTTSTFQNQIDIKIFEPTGKESSFTPQIISQLVGGKERFEIKLPKPERDFKPGKWKMEIEIETERAIFVAEQEFTWGVLAINVNKSIYVLEADNTLIKNAAQNAEKAYIQIAALRDDGHTICDAKLELRIKNQESGIETVLSTENGTIEYSGKCGANNVTDTPDYFAYYELPTATGIYEMKLTNLDNGYEIEDSFEVRESVPFDVERIGPTRIYPPASYEMTMKIKMNQDFQGVIKESVPEGFEITNISANKKSAIVADSLGVFNVVQNSGLSTYYQYSKPRNLVKSLTVDK